MATLSDHRKYTRTNCIFRLYCFVYYSPSQ